MADQHPSQPTDHTPPPSPVLRIDKFAVPPESLDTFVNQMKRIQRTLRTLAGCQRTMVLTQSGGDSGFNVVTLVEWADDAAVAAAGKYMQRWFAREGFTPAAFARELNVRTDLGFYEPA